MKNPQIEWCDHSWRPWRGGPLSRTSLVATKNWSEPVKWNRIAGYGRCSRCKSTRDPSATGNCRSCGEVDRTFTRPRVFPSLCDWLDDEVPIEWLARFLQLIHDTQNLDWLLLTKRPENFRGRLIASIKSWTWADPADVKDRIEAWVDGSRVPQNVWVGTSVEDQQRANERIPELLKIPAKVRFLSVEPLLGPLDLENVPNPGFGEGQSRYNSIERFAWECSGPEYIDVCRCDTGIDWVIVGGESWPKARPCNIDWARSIIRQCAEAGVACFVKQDSGRFPGQQGRIDNETWSHKEFPCAT